ncbi:MAG: RecD-like DNA helicase YrrC, partial [uncultured Sphingomonas sp.]
DHRPPPARIRPEGGRLQAHGAEPDRLRSARRGRDLHGGRAAHARVAARLARGRGAAAGGRRGPAALGRAGAGAGRHHRVRGGAGGAAHRGVPPSRGQPHRDQRPPDQPRQDAGPRGPGGLGLLLRGRARPGGRGGEGAGAGAGSHPAPLRPRPGARRPGALPDEPRRARGAVAERRTPEGAEPAGRGPRRALRLDLLPRRQGHAGGQRPRARGLQRRPRRDRPDRHGGGRTRRRLRGPGGRLRLRRARRAGAGLRHHGAQEPGLGVPGRGRPAHHPALPHAPAQPGLHRRDPGQAAGGAGGAEAGARHRRARPADPPPLVQAEGMAPRL